MKWLLVFRGFIVLYLFNSSSELSNIYICAVTESQIAVHYVGRCTCNSLCLYSGDSLTDFISGYHMYSFYVILPSSVCSPEFWVMATSFIYVAIHDYLPTSLDRIPEGVMIFLTGPERYWGPPSLRRNGYRIFPGDKAAGAWCWPLRPSSAEVKESVRLGLFSPSGSSWLVLRWNLLLIYLPWRRVNESLKY